MQNKNSRFVFIGPSIVQCIKLKWQELWDNIRCDQNSLIMVVSWYVHDRAHNFKYVYWWDHVCIICGMYLISRHLDVIKHITGVQKKLCNDKITLHTLH